MFHQGLRMIVCTAVNYMHAIKANITHLTSLKLVTTVTRSWVLGDVVDFLSSVVQGWRLCT